MQKINSTKIGLQTNLKSIQFSKEYYSLYNNILRDMYKLNDGIFFRFILQAAFQIGFLGYFDELYVDVIKRKNHYKREIYKNFEISFLGEKRLYHKIYKLLCCNRNSNRRMNERQIFYHRKITLFNFDEIIDKYFEFKNKEKETHFINVCEKICSEAFANNLQSNNSNKIKVIPV